MLPRGSANSWGVTAQWLHWTIAVLVVLQMVFAGVAAELPPGEAKQQVLGRHMSIGVIILLLMLIRILWRLLNGAPGEVACLAPWQKWLAQAVRLSLYTLLIALPISGWVMSSSQGVIVDLFGWFELPALAPEHSAGADWLRTTHRLCSWLLGALVVLHAGAALVHHFLLRDGVLGKMLPCPFGGSRR
jgi:cytochrome b561